MYSMTLKCHPLIWILWIHLKKIKLKNMKLTLRSGITSGVTRLMKTGGGVMTPMMMIGIMSLMVMRVSGGIMINGGILFGIR